jgi:hypothetical protein
MWVSRQYFRDVKGEVIEDQPVTPEPRLATTEDTGSAPAAGRSLSSSKEPLLFPAGPASVASETIDAGKRYQEVMTGHTAIAGLLDRARSGDSTALAEIIKRYGTDPNEIEVTITEPMLDGHGNPPELYGIKLIKSEEDWMAITRDWETAAVYFPGIELHNLPTTRRGKRLAVVMGVTARDFNAVIAAERRRTTLEGEIKHLSKRIEKGRKGMGVDKTPPLIVGGDRKPAKETPPRPKLARGAAHEGPR